MIVFKMTKAILIHEDVGHVQEIDLDITPVKNEIFKLFSEQFQEWVSQMQFEKHIKSNAIHSTCIPNAKLHTQYFNDISKIFGWSEVFPSNVPAVHSDQIRGVALNSALLQRQCHHLSGHVNSYFSNHVSQNSLVHQSEIPYAVKRKEIPLECRFWLHKLF